MHLYDTPGYMIGNGFYFVMAMLPIFKLKLK